MSWRDESFAWLGPELDTTTLAARRLRLLDEDLLLPALVLKESALANNIRVMADFCATHGVDLAPHVKVTMSPRIARRQLDAGAWGLTVATVSQAAVLRAHGFTRIMIANEVVDRRAIHWIGDQLRADDELEMLCWVDSVRGVELLETHLAEVGFGGRLPVLVEVGLPGTRGGCRTPRQALEVARAVARSQHLAVAGVAGYEATVERRGGEDAAAEVDRFLDLVGRATEALSDAGAFDTQHEILVSAGGSTWFGRVVTALADLRVGRPVRLVLRSGAYVTHDAERNDARSPLGRNGSPGARLLPAAEAWGAVVSRPEPGLALIGLGTRDVPTNTGLPIAQMLARDGVAKPVPAGCTVIWMNDQHAFLEVPDGADVQVGDLVGCGIHYPCCPGLQKWRTIPVVDDDYVVIDAYRTYP